MGGSLLLPPYAASPSARVEELGRESHQHGANGAKVKQRGTLSGD